MLRTSHFVVAVLVVLVIAALPAAAGTYVFNPSDQDLWDLAHDYYYSWGIAWSIPVGQQITSAELTIKSIDDWTTESNDHLYIHLLDNPALGCKRWTDNEHGGDNWAGNPLIANWSDTNSWAENLSFNLGSIGLIPTLTSYISNNARFGIGFDPDCHYYNCGIKLTICTQDIPVPPVPEPSALLALMSGTITLVGTGLRLHRSA